MSNPGQAESPHRNASSQLLIGEIIRRASESVPNAPAVTVRTPRRGQAPAYSETLSYAELAGKANRLALVLRNQLGVGYGDRVLGWADTSIEVLPLFVALAQIGAVFAPLNARLVAAEAGRVAALARAHLLIVDTDRADDAEQVATAAGTTKWAVLGRGALLDAAALPDSASRVEEPRLQETDPHVIFFTSGSTGQPKGVVLSHRANWLRGFQGVFRDEPERTVCMFPLFHMAAFTLAISAWQTRGEIIFTDASADSMLAACEERGASRLYGLPLIWKRILECDLRNYDLRTLKQLDTGTSATPIELLRRIKERFPDSTVRVYYGSTEAGSALTLSDEDVLRKPGSVGLPSVQVDVRLAEDGEICVRSPFLMQGYFDDPSATEASFDEGWFRTGDLGARDEEGYYSVIGRKKEILRTGGESVAPTEVEAVLREVPGVEDAALVGLPDPDWGDLLCAAVVPAEGAQITLMDLQTACEGRLAGYKKPRRIAILESLPRTGATAQIQRTLLTEEILTRDLARED